MSEEAEHSSEIDGRVTSRRRSPFKLIEVEDPVTADNALQSDERGMNLCYRTLFEPVRLSTYLLMNQRLDPIGVIDKFWRLVSAEMRNKGYAGIPHQGASIAVLELLLA